MSKTVLFENGIRRPMPALTRRGSHPDASEAPLLSAARQDASGQGAIITRHPDRHHLGAYRAEALADGRDIVTAKGRHHHYSALMTGEDAIIHRIEAHTGLLRRERSDPSCQQKEDAP